MVVELSEHVSVLNKIVELPDPPIRRRAKTILEMAQWLAALAKQLRIMGSNPSQRHASYQSP